MGLSSFPSASEGVLPILVMNTVMSVAILKKFIRAISEIIGISSNSYDTQQPITPSFETLSSSSSSSSSCCSNSSRRKRVRGISIIKFKSSNLTPHEEENEVTSSSSSSSTMTTEPSHTSFCVAVECCVCLSKFEEEEEVSELSCKHFFHKKCLDKWFDNHHITCPLCRSIY